jgi:hypothetical protein
MKDEQDLIEQSERLIYAVRHRSPVYARRVASQVENFIIRYFTEDGPTKTKARKKT